VVGIVAGIVLLDERVTAWQWAGEALVVSALAFVMSSNSAAPWNRQRGLERLEPTGSRGVGSRSGVHRNLAAVPVAQ
jgi:hypothetical protein